MIIFIVNNNEFEKHNIHNIYIKNTKFTTKIFNSVNL